MRGIFESVIKRGGYCLSDLLKKIDSYHIEGKLTDAEKDDLYALARGQADPAAGVDVLEKLQELEQRVRKLEGEAPSEEYEEYVPGKWYYAGDKVSFEGKNYVCTAPEGMVCTWSPAEFPAYWEAV